MYWENKFGIPKYKGNLVIFAQKIAQIENLDNNFKNKKNQCNFINYRGVNYIYKKSHLDLSEKLTSLHFCAFTATQYSVT